MFLKRPITLLTTAGIISVVIVIAVFTNLSHQLNSNLSINNRFINERVLFTSNLKRLNQRISRLTSLLTSFSTDVLISADKSVNLPVDYPIDDINALAEDLRISLAELINASGPNSLNSASIAELLPIQSVVQEISQELALVMKLGKQLESVKSTPNVENFLNERQLIVTSLTSISKRLSLIRDNLSQINQKSLARISSSISASESHLANFATTTMIFATISSLLLLAVGLAIILIIVRPMLILSSNLRISVRREKLTELPYVNRNDEIGQLASAISEVRKNYLDRLRAQRDRLELMARSSKGQTKELLAKSQNFQRTIEGLVGTIADNRYALEDVQNIKPEDETASHRLESETGDFKTLSQNFSTTVMPLQNQITQDSQEIEGISAKAHKFVDSARQKSLVAVQKNSTIEQELAQLKTVGVELNGLLSDMRLIALNLVIEASRGPSETGGLTVVASEIHSLLELSVKRSSKLQSVAQKCRRLASEDQISLEDVNISLEGLDELLGDLQQKLSEAKTRPSELGTALCETQIRLQRLAEVLMIVESSNDNERVARKRMASSAQELVRGSQSIIDESTDFLKHIGS